jgi:hypothetical protein
MLALGWHMKGRKVIVEESVTVVTRGEVVVE